MNILFLTLVWPEENEHNLYTDLMKEFRNDNHSVYVVSARERRVGKPTQYSFEQGMHILRVRCGNIQKTNPVEKVFSSTFLGPQMKSAIKKYYSKVKFDLIIFSTPPITIAKTIKSLKRIYRAKTYLLLKDIWPQGPADLGAIKKGGIVWKYFRQKEKQTYELSDYIGCMSPANIKYILDHNKNINVTKVEECPNSIIPREQKIVDVSKIRKKHKIPLDSTVFIFGGNLGKPQGVDFLIDTAIELVDRRDIFFIIVGSGTEYMKIKEKIENSKCRNIMLIEKLPKYEYEDLARASDVGLILLDKCFTIPNFPSRLLSYLDIGMPVLCATDNYTDIGQIVEEAECGFKIEHGNIDSFINVIEKLASDKDLRIQMALNSRKLLVERYTARHSYEVIIRHFKGEKQHV